jgi:tetratricopeptide (TPR) repeat protein
MLELAFDSMGMTLTEGVYLTTDSGQPRVWLEELAERVRPVTLAGEQLLPVPRALEPLLPDAGLRRGRTVAVDGSLALALALVAGASAAGSWVVAVGLPDLGVVAAAEAGIALERLALVPRVGAKAWGTVVAALLEAIDVVLVRLISSAVAVAAADAGAEGPAWRARLDLAWLGLRTGPEHDGAAVAQEAERAIARLAELGDHRGLAKAWLLLAELDNEACRFALLGEHAARAFDHARRAGAVREQHQGLGDLLLALRYGPTPVAEAVRRCGELAGQARGDRFAELSVESARGVLLFMQGRFEESRAQFQRVWAAVEELGLAWAWPFTAIHWMRAELERLAGDLVAAERGLRAVYEYQQRSGDQGFLATTSVELADVLAGLGGDDEALRLTEASRAIAAPGDLSAQVGWRRVRARLLARRGSVQQAERLAGEAVRLAAGTDWLQGHGDALLDLAGVLAAAGRARDAADAARQAAELYQRKGNVVLAGWARRRLAEVAGGPV